MKRTPMPRRKRPLISRSRPAQGRGIGSTLKRSGRVKPVNRKRRASEFKRCYHSKERVAFVKSLSCIVRTIPGHVSAFHLGEIENAHVGRRAGGSRKGPFTEIAPMCRRHHHIFHEGRESFLAAYAMTDELLMTHARLTQALWEQSSAAVPSRETAP